MKTSAFVREHDWMSLNWIYLTKHPRLVDLRVFRVREFPNHLTFYLERENGIEIVRVVHGARDLDALLQDE